MGKTEIEVGRTLDDVGTSFVTAWKKAEAGKIRRAPTRIVFRDWAALCSVLTPKRYELLRALHAAPADSIRALARRLDRDVSPVHADVVALEAIGLVERDANGMLTAPVATITSTIHIAA